MSRDDGFLSRWSRRKLDAETKAATPAPGAPSKPPHASAPGEEHQPLSPEDVASLPRPEDLTSESDIGPFLRAGVPEILKKAALRRMWSIDPVIRDYVGDARDYAYDWNVPGGVPGSGSLPSAEEIDATLARMFSRRTGPEEDAADASGEPSEARLGPPEAEARRAPATLSEPAEKVAEAPVGSNWDHGEPSPPDPAAERPVTPSRRRHGGAVPS